MTIASYDHLEENKKRELLLQCCGSPAWVDKMVHMPAAEDLVDLFEEAEENWYLCTEKDWKEAFTHHPRIGDKEALRKKFASDPFAGKEQSSINAEGEEVLEQLAEANRVYEQRFGYIFIVCATGKSAVEMLAALNERITNSPEEEIQIAMEEQLKITRLRLEKIFES
jgi:2-oxo-4-hydroxy-4-carboxy-5-ureidoimidazoline decarboxylase